MWQFRRTTFYNCIYGRIRLLLLLLLLYWAVFLLGEKEKNLLNNLKSKSHNQKSIAVHLYAHRHPPMVLKEILRLTPSLSRSYCSMLSFFLSFSILLLSCVFFSFLLHYSDVTVQTERKRSAKIQKLTQTMAANQDCSSFSMKWVKM